ncbi:MAG: Ig-like domain-containing protein [Methanosarcinales archaeon]
MISSSTHPSENNWYNNNDPCFSWTTPVDASGISGYSYVLDQYSSTIPNTTIDTTGNSVCYSDISDRTWYFHVRAKDNAGNWGSADHYKVKIDTTPPSAPIPDDGVSGWSNDNTPTFTWNAPSDTSGIEGYYYNIDNGTDTWITSNSVTLSAQRDGNHTFYVKAKDKAGNNGSYGSHNFSIDTTAPIIISANGMDSTTLTVQATDHSGITSVT